MARPKATLRARQQSIDAALMTAQPEPAADPYAADKKVVGITLRLTPALHEVLRAMSFAERTSIHSIVLKSIDHYISERGRDIEATMKQYMETYNRIRQLEPEAVNPAPTRLVRRKATAK